MLVNGGVDRITGIQQTMTSLLWQDATGYPGPSGKRQKDNFSPLNTLMKRNIFYDYKMLIKLT
jgi:hypothetical protein